MKKPVVAAAALITVMAMAGCVGKAPEPQVINCQDPGLSQAEWTRYCYDPAEQREEVESPSAEQESDTERTQFQPFDGGSYTWPNGITVTTKVEVLEPWADDTAFCEGCFNLEADDLRLVLRHTVSVPADHPGVVDADLCSGSLETTTGNDDEALTTVAGDDYKPLSGTILPGKSKFGTTEFGINKDYADEEFVYLNSCGDPAGYEGGMWGGTLPEFTTDQPSNVGEAFDKNTYFKPQVTRVREVGDHYLVNASNCMLAVPPGFDDFVPIGPGYAWTVTADGKKINPAPDSKLNTFDATEVYMESPCVTGWLAFRTSGKKVSTITYLTDTGDKGVWE